MAGREAIEAELLAWMSEARGAPWPRPVDEERFGDLALRLFAFQFAANEAYGRFCRARGATPGKVEHWTAIPAVPTGAFKEVPLRCFPEESTRAVFRTSGTSRAADNRRGALHLDTLTLYDASLMASLDGLFLPDLPAGRRITLRVLAPPPDEAPDSSLSHMFGRLLSERGDGHSGFDVRGGALDAEGLAASLDAAGRDGRPVAVCGTAFAFVHFLDAVGGRRFALPEGSRVMETGGFKGRSREMSRSELAAALSRTLDVPADRIVNQYGMTELGSQFYDSVVADPDGPRRKLGPPWARVRLLDPVTGAEVPEGEVGIVTLHDLANTGSVAAIQTADLGRRIPGRDRGGADAGFEVLGRAPGAEERGCSIAADLMLGAGGG